MLKNLSKNKKIVGIIACIVVVLAVAVPVGMNKLGITSDGKSANKNSQNQSSDESKSNGDNNEGNTDVATSNESNGEQSNTSSNNGNNSESNGEQSNTSSNNGNNSESNGSSNNSSSVENNDTFNGSGDEVSSNYETPDASLIIQRIKAYSGIFIEDGSDKEVKNVAAIQVKNTSNQAVEYAQIELYNGDNKLAFEVSTLPANSSAVVMEKNKTTFSSSKGVTYGKTTVAYTDKLEKSSDIRYTTLDDNGIEITNKSKKDIGCVRVFYKYKSEDGYYVGGITYTAKVENLKVGKSQTIYPSHYVTDGGEIMMVKTYDE